MIVDVLNETADEDDHQVDLASMGRLARFVMEQMRLHPQTEMTLKLIDRSTMTELNTRWMDNDGPTDVLSFPMDELRPGREGNEPTEGYLGDVVICPDYAAEQAPSNGNSTDQEVELLTVHGVLHLMGYDHAEPEEHREMFALQDSLLAGWRAQDGQQDPQQNGPRRPQQNDA